MAYIPSSQNLPPLLSLNLSSITVFNTSTDFQSTLKLPHPSKFSKIASLITYFQLILLLLPYNPPIIPFHAYFIFQIYYISCTYQSCTIRGPRINSCAFDSFWCIYQKNHMYHFETHLIFFYLHFLTQNG